MSVAPARKLPEPLIEDLLTTEVIGGEEMMSPRPARKHINVASQLHTEINSRFGRRRAKDRGPGPGLILMEPELHLGNAPDKVSPDLCGWRPGRTPEINDESAFTTAPDWACEVLSPRTRKWDREKKMPLYHFHRVGHLWMINPVVCELEVYVLGRRRWELIATHSGEEVVRAEPFETMALKLSLLWPAVQPRNPRPVARLKPLKRS